MSVWTRTRAVWQRWRWHWHGVQLGAGHRFGPGVDLDLGRGARGAGQIRLGSGAWLERGVLLHAWGGSITLGEHVFLGPYAVVYGHGGVSIGDHCLISMHCRILSSNHTVGASDQVIRSLPDVLRPTRIGRDVWLGAGVTVLGGVHIGDGCVVGAGAVVSRDLPAGSICRGVPAEVAGWRDGAQPSSAGEP